MTSNSTTANLRNGQWIYPLLVVLQTVGAAIILWNGIPIYQQIVADASKHMPRPETLVQAIVAVAMIQVAYWFRQRIHPPLPQHNNSLLSHVVLFVGRLSLIFATSMFSVVFFMQPEGLHLSISRIVVLVAVLFSMFCFTLELERLGRALQGARERHPERRLPSKQKSTIEMQPL